MPALVFTIDKPYSIRDQDLQVNPMAFLDYWFNGGGPLTLPGGSEGISFVKVPNSTLRKLAFYKNISFNISSLP